MRNAPLQLPYPVEVAIRLLTDKLEHVLLQHLLTDRLPAVGEEVEITMAFTGGRYVGERLVVISRGVYGPTERTPERATLLLRRPITPTTDSPTNPL